MANQLKSYVEKYLLNPASSFNVDEEGEQVTRARVVGEVAENERADRSKQSISKLRARNAALLSQSDPRYKGKKVSRKDLKKDLEDITYDPSLSRFFAVEGESEEDEKDVDEVEDEEEDDEEEEVDEEEEDDDEEEDEGKVEDEEEEMDDEVEEEEEENEDKGISKKERKKRLSLLNQSDEFTFDSDVSKYFEYEDFEDDDDDDDDEGSDEDEDSDGDDDDSGHANEDEEHDNEAHGAEQKTRKKKAIKTFSAESQSDDLEKGLAVKCQLKIYDSLFEARIGMQKVLSDTNQLPQHDMFKHFMDEKNPQFIKSVSKAKLATKALFRVLVEIQELLLSQNPDTKHILSGKKQKVESDEEITSSEDENQEEKEEGRGVKRKLKISECEELLSKRFAASIPFRNTTINSWYEKTKLLFARNAQYKFSGFDVSALQQLQNILSDKAPLILRTQMTGGTRGTTYNVLGRRYSEAEVKNEEYDPEIFDDTDFYSRLLEEMLKSKVAMSNDMVDMSRKFIEIQNLRKKAKKNVDTGASKGRKIRYQVMSKLVQYLAPCYPPKMDDAAMNILFASLFGNSMKNTVVVKDNDEPEEKEKGLSGISLDDLS